MRNFIFSCVAMLGALLGLMGRLWPARLQYLGYLLRRHVVTARHKHRFRSFGEHSLLAQGLTLLAPHHISIGCRVSVMRHCMLETCAPEGMESNLIIADGVSLGEYSHVTCARRIEIGEGVLTGRFVLITDNGHGASLPEESERPPLLRPVHSPGPVIIGRHVWIGDKVTILPNVRIGEGAILAANAVITKDVPPFSIVAGCPAKIVKYIQHEH